MKIIFTLMCFIFILSCYAQKTTNDTIDTELIEIEPLVSFDRFINLPMLSMNDYDLTDEFLNKELYINDSSLYQYKDSCLYSGSLIINLNIDAYTDICDYWPYGNIHGEIINGKKEGKWLEYIAHKASCITKEMNYLNGQLNGNYYVFDAHGDTLSTSTFKKGTGLYVDFYYDTGVLKEKGQLVNGKKEGRWFIYDEKGIVVKAAMYKKDLCIIQ